MFYVFLKDRRRRGSLKVQGEGCESRDFVLISSLSGNQAPNLPCSFLNLFMVPFIGGFCPRSMIHGLRMSQVDDVFRSEVIEGCEGTKVQTLCH